MLKHNQQTNVRTEAMLRTAMGDAIASALDDDSVVEILVNPDGRLWLDKHGEGRVHSGVHLAPNEAERIIRLVASHIGQEATPDAPIISAELPGGGERFEGILPPVTTAPSFAIRKPATKIYTLDDYFDAGMITAHQYDAVIEAIIEKQNILIVGGTGSGKTTLANAILNAIAQYGDRVVIIEDTRELQCTNPDQIALRTRAGHVTLSDLVRSTMRLRPDRIIVGEVRGPEALDMLKVWNTGHPGGISTIHANSAISGLLRLEQLVAERSNTSQRALIAEAIDLVIYISGRGEARKVSSIHEVSSMLSAAGEYETRPINSQSGRNPPSLKSTEKEI